MYSEYWNLGREPFENSLDPAFFFPSQTHQSALLKLRYLIENRKGSGVLVGPTGSGKTLVVHRLMDELGSAAGPWIHVVYPQLSADDLLNYLAIRLSGANVAADHGNLPRSIALRIIEEALQEHIRDQHHPVIVIDDAHLIDDPATLQAIELLLNLQQSLSGSSSLVLLGDRLLLGRISRLPRLDERMSVRSMLQPLSRDEVARYVRFRLEVAGARDPIFDVAALDEIAELSSGVPRRINRLADLALLVGYADQRTLLRSEDVSAVNQELATVGVD